MLPEPKISYKPFWGICRPLNSWRANSPNPIQIYCAKRKALAEVLMLWLNLININVKTINWIFVLIHLLRIHDILVLKY